MPIPEMAGTSEKPLSLKLLVDKRSGRVLFAEAGKEVADFLFGLLHLPMGSVVGLLAPNSEVAGCIANVYRSADSVQPVYPKPEANKDSLLRPRPPLPSAPAEPTKSTYYMCTCNVFYPGKPAYATDRCGAKCPACSGDMKTAVTYIGGETETETETAGGGTTYVVMDDLTVIQYMSALSGTVELLRKFSVTSLESLEETTVDLGIEEGLELLRASFQSKTALTDVFIRGKKGSR